MTHSAAPRITVGVFDADESDLAVRWAAQHAATVGGALHLVHAFVWTELDVNIDPISGMAGSGFRSAAQSLLKDALTIAREDHPDLPITSEVIDGNAVPVLVGVSAEADLLVLGGRGLGRLMTLIVGSKSLALAARAACPVVVVRGRIEGEGPIGLVHHETATEVVTRAADLAEAYGRDIHLIVRPGTTEEQAQEILAGTAQRIALTHPSVFVRDVTVAAADTAKELIEASRDACLTVVAGERSAADDGRVGAPRQLVNVLRFAHTPVWIERD
ncbi:universal stress protein [Brachybacterium sp. YJGR34]|uniref:universal stress protein n=1 Tax=Brachybacterium sp. YJGR34 TaxID=2059911 RepID=UPI000E0A5974|nr:universal stress protein [Brachybacterium sp. YJGR34]